MIPEHSGHCRLCKERVRAMLTAIYGGCRVSHSFFWPAMPHAYENTAVGDPLVRICNGLKDFRGHQDFVKSSQVPPCDFYVSDPPFILEFDKSQHFTQARHITLSLYPPKCKVNFPIDQWLELCRTIDAKDDKPPDRDERRAWYDTLRDLVPPLHELRPTVRVFASEFRWCSLDSQSKKDQETFCSLLEKRLPKRRI